MIIGFKPRGKYLSLFNNKAVTELSLSTYFPKGTQYYYGYPAGEDSGFLNQVPPAVEELVASRAFSCAGNEVTVIGFASTCPPYVSKQLIEAFGIPQLRSTQTLVLPREIDSTLRGVDRNNAIKDFLLNNTNHDALVMAQPYKGKEIAAHYQIPSALATWLNDKNNMCNLIDQRFMPRRFRTYKNGSEFIKSHGRLKLPYVVKAASSSAGDGVFMCTRKGHVQEAFEALGHLDAPILVEEYIDEVRNYGVHFGISYDKNRPVDIIGVNEQLTTEAGEFIGGIIDSVKMPSELMEISTHLLDNVLPYVRRLGWHGVGCFDVLIDKKGQPYFIDSNFRMTGMSAYHFLVANRKIRTPLLSFSGTFRGSEGELKQALLPYAGKNSPHQILQIIAIANHNNEWNFNAAMYFADKKEMQKNIQSLRFTGIESLALNKLS